MKQNENHFLFLKVIKNYMSEINRIKKRSLGLIDATSLVAGSMIGSGTLLLLLWLVISVLRLGF
jgi:hypothetical protein